MKSRSDSEKAKRRGTSKKTKSRSASEKAKSRGTSKNRPTLMFLVSTTAFLCGVLWGTMIFLHHILRDKRRSASFVVNIIKKQVLQKILLSIMMVGFLYRNLEEALL